MSQGDFAKLFENGGSQAVRLPRAFRFRGDLVRVRQTEEGLLLREAFAHAGEWFLQLDAKRRMLRGKRAKSGRRETSKKPQDAK